MQKAIETNNATKGMDLKNGKRHYDSNGNSLGGIKAKVINSDNQQIEVEMGEVIITRDAVSNPKKYKIEGTTKEILSTLNQEGGGVPINETEAEILAKYRNGGKIPREKQIYLGKEGGSNVSSKGMFESAVQMENEGIDSETIRSITGWFINPFDKLWRYEISDENMEIIFDFDSEKLVELESFNNPKLAYKTPLKKVIIHNELFKAYPSIKDLEICFIFDKNSDVASLNVDSNNNVTININLYGNRFRVLPSLPRLNRGADFKAIITHELQHVIQVREGLSGGSSVKQECKKLLSSLPTNEPTRMEVGSSREDFLWGLARRNYLNSLGEIESRDSQKRVYFDKKTRIEIPPYSLINFKNEEVIVIPETKIKFNEGGELIKRADGSYSRRGLYDNIRDNIGSGRKPTKQMLEQESKIKEKYHLGGEIPSLIEKGIVDLKFHETTPEHAEIYGLKAKKPLYIQTLNVKYDKRLQGIGTKVLEYIDSVAKRNGNDVIFGHINQKATFTKDEKETTFNDIDMVKSWLHENGYAVNEDNNDFHKVVKYKEGGNISNMTPSELKEFYASPEGQKLDAQTYSEWKRLVNMSKSELENFYNSVEGKKAGLTTSQAKEQGIDSGRESARWIMKMKDIPYKEWSSDMWRWAKKQIGFIKRMSGMKGELYDKNGNKTRKHTALLIWGHNPETKFAEGGGIGDEVELELYQVRFDTDDDSEIKLVTTSYEDAKSEYEGATIGDFGDSEFSVSLEKKIDKYKFIYELDEDESIDDYPIEEYYDDSYYYELTEEGEFENIENRVITAFNSSSEDLLDEVQEWAKDKFGNYKYNTIDVYSEDDENEENDPIGYIQLRIADHSQNESNLPYGIDRSLSVVIANKDATRGRFQQNRPQIYFSSDDSFDSVIDEIETYIEDAKDDIKSKKFKGGGVISQKALAVETTDLKDYVRKYFVKDGRIDVSDAMQQMFGNKRGKSIAGEYRKRIGLHKKGGMTISQLAHKLWEEYKDDVKGNINDSDFREAVEDVISSEYGVAAMIKSLMEKSDEGIEDEEAKYWAGQFEEGEYDPNDEQLTDEEMSMIFRDMEQAERELYKSKDDMNKGVKEFNDEEVVFHSTSRGGSSFLIVKYRDKFKDYSYTTNNSGGSAPNLNELKKVVNRQMEYSPKVLIDKLNITSDKNIDEVYRDNKLIEEKENKRYSNEKDLVENFKANSESDFNLDKEFDDLYKDIVKLFNSGVSSAKPFFFNNGLKEILDNLNKTKTIKSRRKSLIVFLEKGKGIMSKYIGQADIYAKGLIGEQLFEYLNEKYYKNESELAKGTEHEMEHLDTLKKVAEHKITPEEAVVETAQKHLEENKNYYEDLAKMEKENEDIVELYDFYTKGYENTAYQFGYVPDFNGAKSIEAYSLGSIDGRDKKTEKKSIDEFEKALKHETIETEQEESIPDLIEGLKVLAESLEGAEKKEIEDVIEGLEILLESDDKYAEGGEFRMATGGKIVFKPITTPL